MAKESQACVNGVFLKVAEKSGIPQVDYERYLAEIEDYNYSDEEALQIIQALRSVAEGFADIAWRISPAQSACGKENQQSISLPKSAADMLKSSVKSNQTTHDKNGVDTSPEGSRL